MAKQPKPLPAPVIEHPHPPVAQAESSSTYFTISNLPIPLFFSQTLTQPQSQNQPLCTLLTAAMCTNHYVAPHCPCPPALRERAPCALKQVDPLAPCGLIKDVVHVLPRACNGCRKELKREGIEIGEPYWGVKVREMVAKKMVVWIGSGEP